MNEQNQATQATGSSVAENLSSLIQQAAGTHTSPTFAHILSITSEVLGVVTDEVETALKDKLDVQALNNGLQDVLVGSQQAERGMVAVYGVLKAGKQASATGTAEAACRRAGSRHPQPRDGPADRGLEQVPDAGQ